MLNHNKKLLFILAVCFTLLACHKPPILDKSLAFDVLTESHSTSGYTISIVTNNPHAHGKDARGWTCKDKEHLVDAEIVSCKTSGRSGVYLKFTSEGKKLLVGSPWGDDTLRNARVIAVKKGLIEISSIDRLDETHAVVNYTWAYNKHTPFSNEQLLKTITLNVPQSSQASFTLKDDEWVLGE